MTPAARHSPNATTAIADQFVFSKRVNQLVCSAKLLRVEEERRKQKTYLTLSEAF
jgi:hypothetical protein